MASRNAVRSLSESPVTCRSASADPSLRTGPMNRPSDAVVPWWLVPIAGFVEVTAHEGDHRIDGGLRIRSGGPHEQR